MANSWVSGRKRFRDVFLPVLALLAAGCGTAPRKSSPSASHVAVGSREALFVGVPGVSDSALAALEALDWGDGRFQGELRKELIFQFERKRIPIAKDSAAAEAWLAVRIAAYGTGGTSRWRGEAILRTARGERRMEFSESGSSGGSVERSDPTVDHILQIAKKVAAEAGKGSPAGRKQEPPVQMWMLF